MKNEKLPKLKKSRTELLKKPSTEYLLQEDEISA